MTSLKSLLIKTDKIREDVKNAIAKFLKKVSKSKTIDEAEETLIKEAIAAGVSSAFNGSVKLTADQLEPIASAIVSGLNELDLIIANQLEK